MNSYPVTKVASVATVPAGTWLYATSALEPSPDNICVDPGRDMPYLGQPASKLFRVGLLVQRNEFTLGQAAEPSFLPPSKLPRASLDLFNDHGQFMTFSSLVIT